MPDKALQRRKHLEKPLALRVGPKSGDWPTQPLAWADSPCCVVWAGHSSRLRPNVIPVETVNRLSEWTRIQTVLFANAGAHLAPYSDDQVGMGLNHVMSNNAGDIPHRVNDPSVPLADAMQMMHVLPNLWRECLGPRLESAPSAIGSRGDRLYFVSYMWFDVWPTFWANRHVPEWRDAMWRVWCEMLALPWREAKVSALHGIGHEGVHLNRPKELQTHMDDFIQSVTHDDELKNYAQAAAMGCVQ